MAPPVAGRIFLYSRPILLLKLPRIVNIETGFKLTNSNSRNSAAYTIDPGTGVPQTDAYQTNTFRYRETITAAYLQVSRTFLGLYAQAGLRLKPPTSTAGNWYPGIPTCRSTATDLFPMYTCSTSCSNFRCTTGRQCHLPPQHPATVLRNIESLSQVRGSICIRRWQSPGYSPNSPPTTN